MNSDQKPILEIKGVKKSFGTKAIHRGIDLELYPNEMLALFGGSGTGKSVILRSIIGLETPDAGEITFQNRRISSLNEKELFEVRKKIAYVFQNGALFDSMSVYENLAYSLREHTSLNEKEIETRIGEILELVDLPGTQHLLPSELSGGMQKRVGLARSIILRPEIILYDEPTAGLDPINIKNIVEVMNRLTQRGVSGIFVTHDISAALGVANRIAVLKDGKIYAQCTPVEFENTQDPYMQNFLPETKVS